MVDFLFCGKALFLFLLQVFSFANWSCGDTFLWGLNEMAIESRFAVRGAYSLARSAYVSFARSASVALLLLSKKDD